MCASRILLFIGGILLITGGILPWVSIGGISLGLYRLESGLTGDGIFTGSAGLVLVLISLLHNEQRGTAYASLALILSIVSGGLLLFSITGVSGPLADERLSASVAPGLGWVSPLGALLGFVGALIRHPRTTRTTS